MSTCVFAFGCDRPAVHAGRCSRHSQRYYKYGEDRPNRPVLSTAERFWQYVAKADGCWEWQAAKVRGYGYFRVGALQRKAHRVAYELMVGPIPDGLVLDHTCQNKGCVNPVHLEPVTNAENLSRQGRRMTNCRRGHPFSPENTWLNRRGGRICKTCHRASMSAWWHRQHSQAGYR